MSISEKWTAAAKLCGALSGALGATATAIGASVDDLAAEPGLDEKLAATLAQVRAQVTATQASIAQLAQVLQPLIGPDGDPTRIVQR